MDDLSRQILIELLQQTAQQDRLAFARLYRLTNLKLYPLALRILVEEQAAQDCLQEVFIKVWNKAGQYQADKAAPMTWLFNITRNHAIDQLRKRRGEQNLHNTDESQWDQESLLTRSSVTLSDHYSPRFLHCFDGLETHQQSCLKLAYFEGLSQTEMAEHLEKPQGTIKTWIRRALQQLRGCMES